jgi:hypothetical protein
LDTATGIDKNTVQDFLNESDGEKGEMYEGGPEAVLEKLDKEEEGEVVKAELITKIESGSV